MPGVLGEAIDRVTDHVRGIAGRSCVVKSAWIEHIFADVDRAWWLAAAVDHEGIG